MTGLCAQDVAIANAITTSTLKVETMFSTRLGQEYVAISDEHGLICVELTRDAADDRIAQVHAEIEWRSFREQCGHLLNLTK
jgi:hypothetical protein